MKNVNKTNKVKPGDVINVPLGSKVTATIPKHFAYDNYKGDFSLTTAEVILSGELSYLCGNYIVTNAKMTGGGTGMGPHDVYPDGWEVTATRVEGEDVIRFFQSGCFTCLIREVEVVGKAKHKWVVEEIWQ